MMLEVEVISKETIKPSSPTPDHLRHYQLSFLDQISPAVYNPLVLFYPTQNNQETIEITNQLKQSLSDVLTSFYPLAGRIKDNTLIDCDDQGIPFKEATVKCSLSDVIQNPIPAELNKLLPFEDLDDAEELPLGVQFNTFGGGGVAVGVCCSHKPGDALSFFTFLKSWAATARGERESVRTEFVSASLFPPINLSGFQQRSGITRENIVTKRFVFSASKIEEFKANYTDQTTSLENKKQPSRVEALSAFLWSRYMAVKKKQPAPANRCYVLLHTVNLRTRFEPPLPDYSFGNLYRIAITAPSSKGVEDDKEKGCRLIAQMRESISKIDKEYLKKLQKGSEHVDFLNSMRDRFTSGEMVFFNITSLCRFPMYEADFGWGKPVRVASVRLTFNNVVTFMDAVSGDGIEAWINMVEEDMAELEVDGELLLATATSN